MQEWGQGELRRKVMEDSIIRRCAPGEGHRFVGAQQVDFDEVDGTVDRRRSRPGQHWI
jgi:hypothetical protein